MCGCEASWVENGMRVGAERGRLWAGTEHLESLPQVMQTCIDVGQRVEVDWFMLAPVIDTGHWVVL